MDRTVTVRGTGRLSLKPDTIEASINLNSRHKEYSEAMRLASARANALAEALLALGFEKDELKTGFLNVHTEYEGCHDERGNYRQVFVGYACGQSMTLRFPFDTERLSRVLAAMSACDSEPELNIAFTVRDRGSATDALLESAAKDAEHRARVLAHALGAELGRIMAVDHGVQNPVFYSPTRVNASAKMAFSEEAACMDMGVSPENIELTENASFIWELR